MVTKDALEAALAAHAQWKKRLRDAIATGQSEFTPETVKRDDKCEFGQWLYQLSPTPADEADYQKVKRLHAVFHVTAADILALALRGQKDEALKKLEFGGQYGKDSGELVLALNEWIAKL